MRTTNRGMVKFGLFAGLALSLFGLQGKHVASAAPGPLDLKVERTCGPDVFRPGEWTVYQCLVTLTNTSNEPMPNVSSAWKSASGVIPTHYWVLFEIDGVALPIEPEALKTDPAGVLQPGQSINVRLVALEKMPAEGVYEGTWPTLVDGEPVPGTERNHFEAKADAELPPEDLHVEQISYRKGTQAVFKTTITNNSDSTVTALAFTERYGAETKLVGTNFTYTESNVNASIVRWNLASSNKKSLAPGESIKLQTVYESRYGGDVQSGVLVEATVDGEKQMYGDRADAVCVSCGDESVAPIGGGRGGGGSDASTVPPSAGFEAVSAPRTGEESSTDSMLLTLYVALAVAGVALTGAATLLRRRVRR